MFGDIPERLQCYIDYEALGRDLAVDYTQTDIAGQRLIYRCARGGVQPQVSRPLAALWGASRTDQPIAAKG